MRLRLLTDGFPNRREWRVFAGYLLAAAVYIAIGVSVIDFLLSFWVAVAYIVFTAWAVPTIVRRFT
jgi:tetrahydromethanopterin S-methyltransferase subunit B